MASIKPLGDKVLVKRAKRPTTKGGILLPDSAQEKQKEGIVIAVGPGKVNDQGTRETLSVKVGDNVVFGSYSGTEVKNANSNEEEEYLILSETDILGIKAN